MNKNELNNAITTDLNADTEEYPAEQDAILRKQTVDFNLNIAETGEQIVEGPLRLSGGLTNALGDVVATIFDPTQDPSDQEPTTIFSKEKSDRRYWKRPWWQGSNLGVPGIGIEKDTLAAAADEFEFVQLWDQARIDNSDLENDAARGTWETTFHITEDWNWFPLSVAEVSVKRTVDEDDYAVMIFVISSHQNTTQYQGTFDLEGFSGWIDVIQVKNYLNSKSVMLNGVPHIDIRRVITGVGSSQALSLHQALTLVSPAGVFNSHNVYTPATSNNYINGLVISLSIDANGEDCAEIAEEAGIYVLLGLDTDGVEEHAKLYIGPNSTIITL